MFKAVYILYAKGIYRFPTLLHIEGDSGVKTMKSYNEMRQMVNGIYQAYESGMATAAETAYKIADTIGGISGVRYKHRGLSVTDGRNKFPLNSRNLGKKALRNLISALDDARTGMGYSELHLGKNTSSRHHKAGLFLV